MRPVRQRFLGVSFKMYFDHEQILAWARDVAKIVAANADLLADVELVVIPSFPSLESVQRSFAGTPVVFGAQNVSEHEPGPYTGEVSAETLAQIGVKYVEIGHAERRMHYGDTDAVVRDKAAALLRNQLVPLLCVGEPTPSDPAEAAAYCARQLDDTLGQLPQYAHLPVVVAYEPIWAIGAETPADLEHTVAVCAALREWFASHWPDSYARVVYGGSAGPGLLEQFGDRVDGVFLGRFAHDPSAFGEVMAEALRLSFGRVG